MDLAWFGAILTTEQFIRQHRVAQWYTRQTPSSRIWIPPWALSPVFFTLTSLWCPRLRVPFTAWLQRTTLPHRPLSVSFKCASHHRLEIGNRVNAAHFSRGSAPHTASARRHATLPGSCNKGRDGYCVIVNSTLGPLKWYGPKTELFPSGHAPIHTLIGS